MSVTREYIELTIRSQNATHLPGGRPINDQELEEIYAPLRAWRECGFPQLAPTHKLAASLCCTHAVDSLELTWPWPCFFVLVPSGVIPIPSSASRDGKETEVEALFVKPWASVERGGSITPVSKSRAPLIESPAGTRLFEMCRRLVEGCLIELETPENQEVLKDGPNRPSKRKSPFPTAWTFVLKRDVRIDARSEVRRFCLIGDGPTPSVQVLVRGHHKRQPCGPGRNERRWIHIEPYWRGPEDAPIAVRAHQMGPT